jgi:hypothetical protein
VAARATVTFCTAIRVSGRRMRLRPVDEVVDEIERRQIKRFFLTDDNFGLNFTLDPDYCADLFDRHCRSSICNGWTCQSEMSIAKHPELLEMSVAAHLDKHFVGFESVNPDNRSLAGRQIQRHVPTRRAKRSAPSAATGVGVVGLFVMGFDSDTPETFPGDVGLHPHERAGQRQHDDAHALSGHAFPQRSGGERKSPARCAVEHYDTAHLTFIPKNFTVDELRSAYDWLCRKIYSPTQIARRGLRSLGRYPISKASRKRLFGSFSTDYGYRRTYAYRNEL